MTVNHDAMPELAEDYRGPMLGATLRLTHRAWMDAMVARFHAHGYTDLHPPHFQITALLYERPEGLRSTELAARARISKQAVKELVDHLEKLGYVERCPDPDDRRAHRVRFTEKGARFADICRAELRAQELQALELLGGEQLQALYQMLRTLQASVGS